MNQAVSHKQFQSFSLSGRGGMMAVLDIGTSKISCFIAQAPMGHLPLGGMDMFSASVQVRGVGYHISEGLKAGVVVDMAAAERSIRVAVEAAEKRAGIRIEHVTVGISADGMESHNYSINLPLNGAAIGDNELALALQQARENCRSEQVEVIHVIPIAYKIDDGVNVHDPRGMYGDHLCINVHAITIPVAPLRNLLACIENCHLKPTKLIATPYASALACLDQDEIDLGVLAVDMGSATTSFTVFHDGMPVHADVMPLGGNHITLDIARGLNLSWANAERLKMLRGSALIDISAQNEHFDVLPVGESHESGMQTIDRATLNRIIRARIEEIFELLRSRLADAQLHYFIGRRVVLTGGAAQLGGVCELAQHILEKSVRIGRPKPLKGLPEAVSGPGFAAPVGMIAYIYQTSIDELAPTGANSGLLARMAHWLKRNF